MEVFGAFFVPRYGGFIVQRVASRALELLKLEEKIKNHIVDSADIYICTYVHTCTRGHWIFRVQ